MFKHVHDTVWAFDAEWVPDTVAGRACYELPDSMSDDKVRKEMWRHGGATPEDPRPYLKTVLCRIVSIAVVVRKQISRSKVDVQLWSLPAPGDGAMEEGELVGRFLNGVGRDRPQLVGYNSTGADLPILIQRGIVTGVTARGFCERPNKPWEGVDYFARSGDFHIDLKDVVGGWGKSTPSLHELASAAGVPGKMGVDGNDVVDLWLDGQLDEIVAYNECDALTTYLLWLRTARFAGLFSEDEFAAERQCVEKLLKARQSPHLQRYLELWTARRDRPEAGATPSGRGKSQPPPTKRGRSAGSR